ncbi:hypothetical protein H2202_003678 [Exophiala xenobiotica]|nr:hypothetical protein H2202_003678 [Exophiala xenobiotica]
MHARTLTYAPFPTSMPEERAVRDGALLAHNTRVTGIRIPRVQVTVEMDHTDRAIDFLQTPQDWQDDTVIATETEHAWPLPALPGCGCGVVPQDLPVALLHLAKRVLSVKRRDRDIAAIDDVEVPRRQRIDAPDRVVAAALFLAGTGGTDASRSEACSRPVGCRRVIRKAHDRNVKRRPVRGREATLPREVFEGKVIVRTHRNGRERRFVSVRMRV